METSNSDKTITVWVITGVPNYDDNVRVLGVTTDEEEAKKGVSYYRNDGYFSVDYDAYTIETFEKMVKTYCATITINLLPSNDPNIYNVVRITGVPSETYYAEADIKQKTQAHYKLFSTLDSDASDAKYSCELRFMTTDPNCIIVNGKYRKVNAEWVIELLNSLGIPKFKGDCLFNNLELL